MFWKKPTSAVRDAGSSPARAAPGSYPDNPVLVRAWRGKEVESQHRGAWVLCDSGGAVIDAAGSFEAPVFARSSIKSLQALALVESGAAERFRVSEAELALACSSHNAEPCHTEPVAAWLARIGLEPRHLRCGPQPPGDPETRAALAASGGKPGALHNNCSGKHAGFLTLSQHLGADPAAYLEPAGAVQGAVRQAVLEMCDLAAPAVETAVDGCSAPTFRVPLASLAGALARLSNPAAAPTLAPARRAACERLLEAVAKHPQLIAGRHKRLCTDLARASSGRLFPKIGAEAVYVIGARGKGRGLAVKLDDGGERGLAPLVLALIEKFQLLPPSDLGPLDAWREKVLYNRAGLMVGRTEVLV